MQSQKYKQTNIPWIGEIPEEWNIVPLKRNFSFEKGKDAQIFTAEYCGSHLGEFPVYSGQTENNGVMGMIDSYIYESGRRLFVTTVGAKAMTVKILFGKYSLSQNCALIIERNNDVNVDFYYYLLQIQFAYEKGLLADVMQPSLRFEDLVKYKIPLPPLSNQIAIANFLDQKTTEIKKFIKNKKALIDLLREQKQSIIHRAVTKGVNPDVKMKDSRASWIGEIPEDWQVKKLKYVLDDIQIGPFGSMIKSEVLKEEGYKIYGQENIINTDFSIGGRYIDDNKFKELRKYQVFPGELLVSMMGTIGKCEIVPDEINTGIIDSHLMKFSLNKKMILNAFFQKAYCDSRYIWHQLVLENKGSIMMGLNSTIIKNLLVVIPPVKQQEVIINYLQQEVLKIDTAIETIEREIALIEEYRTSLIYQAVTGKISIL